MRWTRSARRRQGMQTVRYRYDPAVGRVVPASPGARAAGPFVRGDLPGYRSPVTGRWIEGRRARREDLAATGCRAVDPGERTPLFPGQRNPR